MTLPHLAVSDLMYAPNSSGVLLSSSAPSATKRSLISLVYRIFTISALIFVVISFGVPVGARKPAQPTVSKPG